MTEQAYIDIECTDKYFPEYPEVSAFVYYKDSDENKIPIKDMNMQLDVFSKDSHDNKYVTMRQDYTNKEGIVRFKIFPMQWLETADWQKRVVAPTVEVDDEGNVTVKDNIPDWNKEYSVGPVSRPGDSAVENAKISCKVSFAKDNNPEDPNKPYNGESNPWEMNYSGKTATKRFFSLAESTSKVGWWKCKTKIKISRFNGTFTPLEFKWNLEAKNPQIYWIHLIQENENGFGTYGAGISTSKDITYNVYFTDSVGNITISNSTKSGNVVAKSYTNVDSRTECSSTLTLFDGTNGDVGMGWVEIPYPNKLTTAVVTFSYPGNSFFDSAEIDSTGKPARCTWITNNNTYCFESITTEGSIHYKYDSAENAYINKQTIKGKIVNYSDGNAISSKAFDVYLGSTKEGSFNTKSDGTFTYTIINPPSTGLSTYLKYIIKDSSNNSMCTLGIQCLDKYTLSINTNCSDELTTFSQEQVKLNLKKNGTVISETDSIKLKVEYRRDGTSSWSPTRYYGFYYNDLKDSHDDNLESVNGVITYNFSKKYKEENQTPYINKYTPTSIRYAGYYKFTFEYSPSDKEGVQFSFTKRFNPIGTYFVISDAPTLAEATKSVGTQCTTNCTLYDNNGVEIPSAHVSKYMIPSKDVYGNFVSGDDLELLEAGKQYDRYTDRNDSKAYRSVFLGKNGGGAIIFQPTSRGDMYYTSHFTFNPNETPDCKDVYQTCSASGKYYWTKIKPTITLSVDETSMHNNSDNEKALYVNQQGKITATVKTKIPDKDWDESVKSKPYASLQLDSSVIWTDLNDKNPTTSSNVGTYTTNSAGNALVNYTSSNGDVKGVFTFKSKVGTSDIYSEADSKNITVEWDKYDTTFSLVSITDANLFVTKQGYARVRLTYNNGSADKSVTGETVARKVSLSEKVEGKETSDGATITKKEIDLTSDNNTNVTDSSGYVSATYYVTSKGNIKGTFKFTYDGSDMYRGTTYTTEEIEWKKFPTTITKNSDVVDNTVTDACSADIILTFNNGSEDKPLSGKSIIKQILFDETVTGGETINNTSSNKTFTLTPSNTAKGITSASFVVINKGSIKGKFTFKFEGDDLYEASNLYTSDKVTWSKITPIYNYYSHTSLVSASSVGKIKIKVQYKDGLGNTKDLKNFTVARKLSFYKGATSTDNSSSNEIKVSGHEEGSSTIKTGKSFYISEATSDSNGFVETTFVPTSIGGIHAIFACGNSPSDMYYKTDEIQFTEYPIGWSKMSLTIVPYNYSQDIYVNDKGYVTVQLLDGENNAISGYDVNVEITFYDDNGTQILSTNSNNLLPDKATDAGTSDKDGLVTGGYTNTKLGNIHAKFKFELAENDMYSGSYEVEKIKNKYVAYWKKIPTKLEITRNTSNNGNLEVKKQGTVEATLYNTKNTPPTIITTKEKITRSITFTTINPKDTIKFTPPTLDDKYINESGKVGTSYTPDVQGDIVGTFKFKLENNNIYADSNEAKDTITWHKIKTKIVPFNTTIYNGRYTNIANEVGDWDKEPAWNEPSKGVTDKTYKNFRVKLLATYIYSNVEDEGVEGRTIHAKYNGVQKFDYNLTNSNGIALQRWTITIANLSKQYIDYTCTNVFDGDDIYQASENTFRLRILKRITTVLSEYTNILHPPNFRYKVPFDFGMYLKTDSGEILDNQKVELIFNETSQGMKTTDSNGIAQVKNYSYDNVGKVTITGNFDENDEIDKYLPVTWSYEITVEKDYTSMTLAPGDSVYTSCDDAKITCKLVDSLDRAIESQDIHLQYDDGTYSAPKWLDFENGKLITNTNGRAYYYAKAYSGIRLLKGTYYGSKFYKSCIASNELEYDIQRTYTKEVNDGIAEIIIDCIKDSSNGIPEGLYDVDIKYIPPTMATGKCTLYGSASLVKPVRKKKSTYLTDMTPTKDKTVESKCPVFVTAKLTNENDNPMPNEQIHTNVNNLYPSKPYHLTDENGLVIRGNRNDTIGQTYTIHFQFNQTRDRIGAMLDVDTYTTKITPMLVPTVNPATTYSGMEVLLKVLFYEMRYKYTSNGYEVKQMQDGRRIYYNKLESYLGNPEYYTLDGETRIEATKDEYDNATHVDLKKLLPNKTVTWSNSTKAIGTGVTDKNGLASTTFIKKTPARYTLWVTTEEDDTYFAKNEKQYIDVLPKIKPYFEEIDYTLANKHVIYGHSVLLGTHLYYDENGTQTAFKNQSIVFSQGSTTLGTKKTNDSGYAEVNYTVVNYPTFTYKVAFTGYNQYENASMTYTVNVDKQTPILSLSSSKTTVTIGDTITLSATLTSDNTTSNKALSGMNIVFYDGNRTIGTVKTNSEGVATINYKLTSAGTSKPFSAKYTTTSDSGYDTAEKTIQIKVNKIATHFESPDGAEIEIPGGTSQTYSLILKDASNNALLAKPVSISYNNKTTTTNSDNSGKVTIETGKQDKGVTKSATFTFTEDANYQGCTYTLSIKWGEYPDDEDCTDLDAFDTLLENWYASDGTAKYGIDAATGKYKIDSTPILDTRGSPSCRKNGRTGLCLRCICNDLKEEGTYDAEDDCVSAPTGVILRSKRLITSSKCSVTFYFQIKYNGASNSISKNLYGGHFGLMSSSATTAESAPLRFEMYRRNVYVISNGGNAVYSNLRYSMDANKKYYVKWDIDGKKFSVTIYDETMNEIKKSQSFTAQSSLEGLHPYCFAYTNGTSFVLSHINIKRE